MQRAMERCCGDLSSHISDSWDIYTNMDRQLLSKCVIHHLIDKDGINDMLRSSKGVSNDEDGSRNFEKTLPNRQ